MTTALPLYAEGPSRAEPLPVVEEAILPPFARASIALVVVAERWLEPACAALRAALLEERVFAFELHTRVLGEGGREVRLAQGLRIEAPLVELHARLRDAERAASDARLLVATGPAVLALRRPSVAVLVTGGVPRGEWGADVRSVRSRAQLIVPALDVALARELVTRLAA